MLTSKFLFGYGLLSPDAHLARGLALFSGWLGEVRTSGFLFPPVYGLLFFLLNVWVIVCTSHLLTGLRAFSGASLGRFVLVLALWVHGPCWWKGRFCVVFNNKLKWLIMLCNCTKQTRIMSSVQNRLRINVNYVLLIKLEFTMVYLFGIWLNWYFNIGMLSVQGRLKYHCKLSSSSNVCVYYSLPLWHMINLLLKYMHVCECTVFVGHVY
jgi:hypothetical protein